MDDLADQVQSLFYHDIHFNTINTHMHTRLECKTPHGLKSKEMFKMDTGADGNLMPITMFVRLFPKLSLKTLEKLWEKESHCVQQHPSQAIWCLKCKIKL